MAPSPDFTTEFGANAPFVADLFARFRENPTAVSEDWRDYFQRLDGANGQAPQARSDRADAIAPAKVPKHQPGTEPIRGINPTGPPPHALGDSS